MWYNENCSPLSWIVWVARNLWQAFRCRFNHKWWCKFNVEGDRKELVSRNVQVNLTRFIETMWISRKARSMFRSCQKLNRNFSLINLNTSEKKAKKKYITISRCYIIINETLIRFNCIMDSIRLEYVSWGLVWGLEVQSGLVQTKIKDRHCQFLSYLTLMEWVELILINSNLLIDHTTRNWQTDFCFTSYPKVIWYDSYLAS